MAESSEYADNLRSLRALLIVTSLQDRKDVQARRLVEGFPGRLRWSRPRLMIDPGVWKYAVDGRGYDPKLVFCHPDVLRHDPRTSLYYRGLSALSLKAARESLGDVAVLERGDGTTPLDAARSLKMARVYNALTCSIVKNSTDWTLENGYRTIIASLGITLDGVMRNTVGSIAEARVRSLVLDYVIGAGLLDEPLDASLAAYELRGGITMRYSSEPDISFVSPHGELLAVVEIKGGIDAAGALERYGAATKSFQQASRESQRCRNFFISGAITPELRRRIRTDRLVEKSYDLVAVLYDQTVRESFLKELFHFTLRLV